MGSKAKTPAAPDYASLVRQQAAEQNKLIDKQTQANRPDQTNPFGSVKWSQDENGNWSQNVSYDPRVQGNLNSMLEALQGLTGNMKGTFDPEVLGKYDQYKIQTGQFDPQSSWEYGGQNNGTGGDKYADAFTKSLMARTTPQQETDRASMENRLRLQGLQPGTPAYDRAYKNLLTSQGDVNSQAALKGMLAASENARADYATQLSRDQLGLNAAIGNQQMTNATQGQQFQQGLQTHMLPYQQAQALTGMMGQMIPSFDGFTPAGVGNAADIVGAAQQSYAQQMQAANDKNARKSGKGQSIGSIAGGVLGGVFGGPVGAAAGSSIGGAAGGAIFSDATMKHDLFELSDRRCYEMMRQLIPTGWKWNVAGVMDAGVIAQDVERMMPELIERQAAGLLSVNYSGLFAVLLGAFRHLAAQKEDANGDR